MSGPVSAIKIYNMKKHLFVLFIICLSFNGFTQISNPRAWAEFEETRGIIINQPFRWKNVTPEKPDWVFNQCEEHDSVYIKLINEALYQNIDVYYILSTLSPIDEFNPAILDTMINRYGINTDHPNFHIIEIDREIYKPNQWVRDHGPMNVYKNGVDSLYNILFADGMIGAGKIVSQYLEIPTCEISDEATGGFASFGGNYMVDGNKSAIIDEGRPDEKAQLPFYASLFGLDDIYTVPTYLRHIDYFMKLVNEETLLVSEQLVSNYTTGIEYYTYEQDTTFLFDAINYIQQNALSQYGRPLKIHTIPNAPSFDSTAINLSYFTNDASYINSLIVNNAVFVPQFSNPETDTLAINMYRKTMPGYKIIPVTSRFLAQGSGAVHCMTNSIATDEPIWIQHAWLPDSVGNTADYEIKATILTRSGIKSSNIYWTTDLNTPF
jgi:agmatine/peptidylarginine deiminase